MKNLEHLITEVNKFYEKRDIDSMFDYARSMVDQYAAGKQEQHNRVINSIEIKYRKGIASKNSKEMYAKRELGKLITNVCLQEKVI